MFVRSERLFLRPRWPEDWREFYPLIADDGVVRNLARAPWPYTEEDARSFLQFEQKPGLPTFFVTLPGPEGARIVGSIGLGESNGEAELGYWIARPYWGRGYATEAARTVLSLARTLGHKRIVGRHFVDNPASGRVLVKAGFRPLGRVVELHSAGRGEASPAATYAAELGDPGDCDVGNAMKRAA
jgi:RimJ/RimL family protein N-acetyltransferase